MARFAASRQPDGVYDKDKLAVDAWRAPKRILARLEGRRQDDGQHKLDQRDHTPA